MKGSGLHLRPPSSGTFILVALFLLASSPGNAGELKFDVLHLKNGTHFHGLLVRETESEIHFRCVRRNPGSPTSVILDVFPRDLVLSIDRLETAERAETEAWLGKLDRSGKAAAERRAQFDLKPVPWIKEGGGKALCYRSRYFVLISNAREDIVRRAADQLDQIYAAYVRYLPPRKVGGKATTIRLVRSLDEYHALLKQQGRDLLNPAFFDPAQNLIVCASDLERLGEDLERARKQAQQALRHLDEERADWITLYKGRIPPSFLKQYAEARRQIEQGKTNNDGRFQEATRSLFQTLYHEACHAYLANFVYPPDEAEVPRWLNEGLAQTFETAILEAGDLRVGHADERRLQQYQENVRKGENLTLEDLLRAGPKHFVMAHASDRQVSDQHYLGSWALTFYLMFDRKLLGTPALDRYVQSLKEGTDPVAAFQDLTGKSLAVFDKEFKTYALSLRPDGTAGR